MSTERRHIDSLLVHGHEESPSESGATLPPVVLSTAFASESAEQAQAIFLGQEQGHVYSRLSNPTVDRFERRITEICDGAGALAVASGMSAVAMSLLGLLRAGDEIIASRYLFGGSYTFFDQTLRDLGITTHFVDPRCVQAAESLVGPQTKALFLEAIANPAMVVPDFKAFRGMCDRTGVPLIVDVTLLTPYLFDAQALGADIAIFSASKFFAGAASSMGGIILDTGRFPWHQSERFDFTEYRRAGQGAYLAKLSKRLMADIGPCLAPMNAFMFLTGLETLALRMERHCDNAQTIAEFLAEHPRVKDVQFPGLAGHPAHELCKRQFRGRFGSVLSFTLADKAACFRVLNRLRLLKLVTNLGDTRTLVTHPASTIYSTFWKGDQEQVGVTENLIRLSAGIENSGDLLADLDQALAQG